VRACVCVCKCVCIFPTWRHSRTIRQCRCTATHALNSTSSLSLYSVLSCERSMHIAMSCSETDAARSVCLSCEMVKCSGSSILSDFRFTINDCLFTDSFRLRGGTILATDRVEGTLGPWEGGWVLWRVIASNIAPAKNFVLNFSAHTTPWKSAWRNSLCLPTIMSWPAWRCCAKNRPNCGRYSVFVFTQRGVRVFVFEAANWD